MSLPIFLHPHRSDFWQSARARLLRHYKISSTRKADVPRKVVYVDRQTTDRRLVDADHEGLVGVLEHLHREKRIDYVHATLEEMSGVEQVRMVADTWVSGVLVLASDEGKLRC